jgi:hypothetical protein
LASGLLFGDELLMRRNGIGGLLRLLFFIFMVGHLDSLPLIFQAPSL